MLAQNASNRAAYLEEYSYQTKEDQEILHCLHRESSCQGLNARSHTEKIIICCELYGMLINVKRDFGTVRFHCARGVDGILKLLEETVLLSVIFEY